MPPNPLTRLARNAVKAPLTPQTPGDWLLARFEQRLGQHRTEGVIRNREGDPTIHIQPMFSLKEIVTVDPAERMDTGPEDYDDGGRWL